MNNDLISRSELKKAVDKRGKSDCVDWFEGVYSIADMYDLIDNAPTVNTVNLEKQSFIDGFKEGCEHGKKCYERPQGEWITIGEEQGALGIIYKIRKCSKCGWEHSLVIPDNFCPNCGADMRGDKE